MEIVSARVMPYDEYDSPETSGSYEIVCLSANSTREYYIESAVKRDKLGYGVFEIEAKKIIDLFFSEDAVDLRRCDMDLLVRV